MSESDNKKARRPLKNLPPDRFQPKMLIFWLALVAAVLALLYYTPGMSSQPDNLTIQDVVERAESLSVALRSAITASATMNSLSFMTVAKPIGNGAFPPLLIAGNEKANIIKTMLCLFLLYSVIVNDSLLLFRIFLSIILLL